MILEIDGHLKRGKRVPDCLVKTLLESREEELDHLDMSMLCSASVIGGVETVSQAPLRYYGKILAELDIT